MLQPWLQRARMEKSHQRSLTWPMHLSRWWVLPSSRAKLKYSPPSNVERLTLAYRSRPSPLAIRARIRCRTFWASLPRAKIATCSTLTRFIRWRNGPQASACHCLNMHPFSKRIPVRLSPERAKHSTTFGPSWNDADSNRKIGPGFALGLERHGDVVGVSSHRQTKRKSRKHKKRWKSDLPTIVPPPS